MNKTAIIAHKRQLTMTQLIDKLAGSVAVPARLRHLKNTDAIIKKAKEEYFNDQTRHSLPSSR